MWNRVVIVSLFVMLLPAGWGVIGMLADGTRRVISVATVSQLYDQLTATTVAISALRMTR
jgi:hypothetical protein